MLEYQNAPLSSGYYRSTRCSLCKQARGGMTYTVSGIEKLIVQVEGNSIRSLAIVLNRRAVRSVIWIVVGDENIPAGLPSALLPLPLDHLHLGHYAWL